MIGRGFNKPAMNILAKKNGFAAAHVDLSSRASVDIFRKAAKTFTDEAVHCSSRRRCRPRDPTYATRSSQSGSSCRSSVMFQLGSRQIPAQSRFSVASGFKTFSQKDRDGSWGSCDYIRDHVSRVFGQLQAVGPRVRHVHLCGDRNNPLEVSPTPAWRSNLVSLEADLGRNGRRRPLVRRR